MHCMQQCISLSNFFFFLLSIYSNVSDVGKLTLILLAVYIFYRKVYKLYRVQELCESQGGHPGLSVLMSFTVSVDVKQYWTVFQHWSQFVPNMSTDIWGHEAVLHHTNFTKEDVVSTIELLHPKDKMLKQGLWQNYKQLVWCCSHENHFSINW